jgi:hypothetical protein
VTSPPRILTRLEVVTEGSVGPVGSGDIPEHWPMPPFWPCHLLSVPEAVRTGAPCHHLSVTKASVGAGLLLSAAALVVAIAAFRETRQANVPPTDAEIAAAAVREFQAAGNRMTPAQVLRLLGEPDQVYRNNPRALCWRYMAPYVIEMCWGPKRRRAWIAHNIPPEDSRA